MSIYTLQQIGDQDNQIQLNNYQIDPVFQVENRAPQKYQLREEDFPVPFDNGISDFLTLIGQTVYLIKGVMYPSSESSYDAGLAALRHVSSLSAQQNDPYSDDEGYVPYQWSDSSGTLSKQLFVKILYVMMTEDMRQGFVQPFTLVCKIKDPTIYGTTLKTASTQQGAPVLQNTITNLIPNPSFEVGTTGWAAYHGATIAQSSAQAYVGSNSLSAAITSGSAMGASGPTVTGLTPSTSYTFSVYVLAPVGVSVTVEVDSYTSGGSFVAAYSVNATGTGGWIRITKTIPLGATETELQPFVYANATGTLYIDAAMLQLGASATAYFDGSFASNLSNTYAWTGTANNSASTNAVYGTGSALFPTGFPVAFGATIYATGADADNAGTEQTDPVSISVFGPITNPRITNSKTGEYIEVDVTLSSVNDQLFIQYSSDNLSVTLNGVSVLNKVTSASTYFKIQPGDQIIQLSGQIVNAGAYANVNFYDAFALA